MVYLCNDQLLLGLQALDDRERHVKSSGHDFGRRQCQPLGQADVGNAVGLVELDPHELLGLRSVFDIVAGVIWEDRSVTSCEVKGPGVRASKEDGCLGCTGVEVDPFRGLDSR